MISKFSVKKPYTVLVAVIMVIILGVVSLMKMTTDLLPSISLPYVIVMTTYPGASPETVEMVVTKPIEASMATISNVESISSTSSENYSMVIMEFAQSANMDSASLEIRESLDQIKSYWDDSIGNPIIMKLNPDMLPVMVAAVGMEGMDTAEISDYTTDYLIPELESIEGVASASASGLLQESVHVIIREDKIAALNEKIFGAIDSEMEDAKKELEDGKKELADGKAELADGWKEIDENLADMEEAKQELADGKQEIADGKANLANGKEELKNQKEETAQKLAENTALLVDAIAQIEANKASVNMMIVQMEPIIKAMEEAGQTKETLQESVNEIKQVENEIVSVQNVMNTVSGNEIAGDDSLISDSVSDWNATPQLQMLAESITLVLNDGGAWMMYSSLTWGQLKEMVMVKAEAAQQGLELFEQYEQAKAGIAELDKAKEEAEKGLEALTKAKLKQQSASAVPMHS